MAAVSTVKVVKAWQRLSHFELPNLGRRRRIDKGMGTEGLRLRRPGPGRDPVRDGVAGAQEKRAVGSEAGGVVLVG